MSRGNKNLICGPLVPPDVRQAAGWQSVPYDNFIFTANALRSVAHVIGFNVRPLYLECGSSLNDTERELSRRLVIEAYESVMPGEEIPERRKFFMRLLGRDPDKLRYPLIFPSGFEAARGKAAERWAVSAPNGIEVLQAAESLLQFAGPEGANFIEILKKESPKFAADRMLESIQAAVVRPSGYIHRLLSVARPAADHSTYFLSWWG